MPLRSTDCLGSPDGSGQLDYTSIRPDVRQRNLPTDYGSTKTGNSHLSLANSQFRPPLVVETIHGNAFPSDTD